MTIGQAVAYTAPIHGIIPIEPIGSSKNPPFAEVALLPQMWQLSFSLPPRNGRWRGLP